VVSPEDLDLFQFADDPAQALQLLKKGIASNGGEAGSPAFAKSVTAHPSAVVRSKRGKG
jgi:hypothetical protein